MTLLLDPKKFSQLTSADTLDGTELIPIVKDGANKKVTSQLLATLAVSDVISVNGKSGVVELDTSDIDDTADKRYVTDAEKTKLANTSGTNTGDQDLSGLVPKTTTVNGHALTGNIIVSKSDIGLGSVDDTADLDKPVSAAAQAALDLKQDLSQRGQADGYASLDSGGKVPVAQLPSSIMEYKGTWNAATNTPTLADGSGDTGDVYRVTVAGTRNLGSGPISFSVGDYVVYNGSIWEKSDTTDSVPTVFGRTGNVVAQSGDYTGSQITNVPAGNLISTDVQGALNELDSEKVAQTTTVNGHALTGNITVTAADLGLATVATTGAYADLTGKPTSMAPSGAAGGDLGGTYPNPTVSFANDTLHVLKAGDTMTGDLNIGTAAGQQKLVLVGITSAATLQIYHDQFNARYVNSAGAHVFHQVIQANASNTIDLGATTAYFRNTYSVKVTLNSTAELSGATAGAITTAALIGLATTAPTHSLTLSSTATGIALYNTSDQVTNYERVLMQWSGNTFSIIGSVGGTGTPRNLALGTANRTALLTFVDSAGSAGFVRFNPGTSTASATGVAFGGVWNASSGINPIAMINPTISQTSTAGYTALLVNPTESSTGSGAKLLMDLQVGGTSRFNVANTGLTTITNAGGSGLNVIVPSLTSAITIQSTAGSVGEGVYYGAQARSRFGYRNGQIVIDDGRNNAGGTVADGTTASKNFQMWLGGLNVMQMTTTGMSLGVTAADTKLVDATHTLTLNSTATGIALYNTADQTTNYERLLIQTSSNQFLIKHDNGGTGAVRDIVIGNTKTLRIANGQSVSGSYQFTFGLSVPNTAAVVFSHSLSSASGVNPLVNITSTTTQTSTAGYTGLKVNIIETTTGSGAKLLMDLQRDNISQFSVDRAGEVYNQSRKWQPSDQNLITWSYDPTAVNGGAIPLAAAGTLYVVKVRIPQATSVTNIITYINTAGSGLTAGQCFAAIYQNGSLLGATADQAVNWASTGLLTMPISGGAVAVAAGYAYIAFWFNGTTGPAFYRAAGSSLINAGLTAATSRFGSADTGRTTTAPATLGTISALSVAYWAALS